MNRNNVVDRKKDFISLPLMLCLIVFVVSSACKLPTDDDKKKDPDDEPEIVMGPALTAWANTTAFTTARTLATAAAYADNLYILGGDSGVNQDDVQYVGIEADGSLQSPWILNLESLDSPPGARNGLTSAILGSELYVIGGDSGGALDTVESAAFGSLGAFGDETSLTTASAGHATVVYKDRIYVIGGATLTRIEFADTGMVWATTTALDEIRSSHAAVAYKNRLYVLGGSGTLTSVKSIEINPDGTIGAVWTDETDLPASRQAHTCHVYNGYIYLIGGADAGFAAQDTVYYIKIKADGSLDSTWVATKPLATGVFEHASVLYKDHLYVLGGINSSFARVNEVQYAAFKEQ